MLSMMESYLIPLVSYSSTCLLSLFIVAGLTIFHKIKFRWPVKVNCWFCNSNIRIWRKQLNWWLCPSCQQYNGFTKDGDYKYVIPEQINVKSTNYSVSNKTKLTDYQNGLCDTCNNNEEFKLMELRNFENSQNRHSERDLKKFRQKCDEKYPLCTDCENTVERSLYKQSLWLAEYRILFMRKSIQAVFHSKSTMEKVYKVILISANLAMAYRNLLWLPLICGIFVQLILTVTNISRKKLPNNLLLTLLWVNIGVLQTLPEIPLFIFNVADSRDFLSHLTTSHMVLLLQAIIGFETLNIKLTRSGLKSKICFEKIESYRKNLLLPEKPKVNGNLITDQSISSCSSSPSPCHSPVNMTNVLTTSVPVEAPVPLKMNPFSKKTSSEKPSFSTQPEDTFMFLSPPNSDLNRSLGDLSLDEGPDRASSRCSAAFSSKAFGATSPDLFQKKRTRKIVLAPSKLRVAPPSAWPTSQFWQDLDMPHISRSSSQSSGFASNVSEPCRENSVFDVDRFSVMSDPICHRKQSAVRSRGCENCKSPSCGKSRKDGCLRDGTLSRCSVYSTNCDFSVEKANVTTIVTSPAWLPVLLCGSVLFNVAVLCVVLLR